MVAQFERVVLPSGRVTVIETVSPTNSVDAATLLLQLQKSKEETSKRIDNPTELKEQTYEPPAYTAKGISPSNDQAVTK